MKKRTLVLLIAEFEGELSSQEVQRKLDAFRTAVMPGDFGITLYRAQTFETRCFDLYGGPPDRLVGPRHVETEA